MQSEHSLQLFNSSDKGKRPVLIRLRDNFIDLAQRERSFLILLATFFFIAGATFDKPYIAMWVGFAFAAYSAIANDSIQTIGTFIASNKQQKWWVLWLFMGSIFLATVSYSWYNYGGDVSYQRLASKGFETAPTSFSFLQIAAPVFLMILTRLRMPVSTTFLLLSCFATTGTSIQKILSKSLMGYFLAFAVAILMWTVLAKMIHRKYDTPAHPAWRVGQWITSGMLWSVWIMQDAANVAVFLPRALGMYEFFVFAGVIFFGLGLLFFMGGERIQEVVDEKTDVVDVRAATVIDLIYAFILFYFKLHSKVPMSTTWVFLGLLAGREVGLTLMKNGGNGRGVKDAFRMIGRDASYALIGLAVSLALAMTINKALFNSILASFTSLFS